MAAAISLKASVGLGLCVRPLAGSWASPVTLCRALALSPLVAHVQSAGIAGKNIRDKSIKKPAPFPYRTKKYRAWHAFWDMTTERFDENTKLVVVEGNVAAGKANVAKALAEELEMLYVPAAHMDMVYINTAGFDTKQLDPALPPDTRSFTVADFNKNPHHKHAFFLQHSMNIIRYNQYVDSLAHIMNTGQGVVMDRCVYSDYIFLEAMHKFGYVTKAAKNYYYEVKKNTMMDLMQPHLVIYLDVPVPEIQKRIQKRNIPDEVQSKVLTPEYLSTIENLYKHDYLKNMSNHAHVLIYDWSGYGDPEYIVEDIERLDFEKHEKDHHDPKMQDWWLPNEDEWAEKRYLFTRNKWKLMSYFNIPPFGVPELMIDGMVYNDYENIWSEAPGNKYQPGYDKRLGVSGLLFKTKNFLREYATPVPFKEWWIPEK